MPRHNTHQNPEKRIGGYCKIRKRVSSSSSSSSVVNNYRFKRAILVGKKVGSTTPVPSWKVLMAGSDSPGQKFENGVNKYTKDTSYANNTNTNTNNNTNKGLSARKLGATLWEIKGLHSPGGLKDETFEERRERERGRKNSDRVGKFFDDEHHLLMDQNPHSPVCQKIDGSKVGGHRRRSSSTSQRLQITEYITGGLDTVGKATSMEVGSHTQEDNNSSIKTRLKDVNNSLIASKELVKVLFRIMSQEDHQSSRLTLVSALRVELERARLQVNQLIQEQRVSSTQIEALQKQFEEEKSAWRSKEKGRIREAISSLVRELDIERKLRRQAERMNKTLGMELADTRAHFSRVLKEFDEEKREREILEQTCDDLARGIGEERVEVEELKKESEKVLEEVEKERQMLQLADVLREERVQMKLTEARYEYEEKNAALERWKRELETHLKNEASKENGHSFSDFLMKTRFGSPTNEENEDGFSNFLKKTKLGSHTNDENGDGFSEFLKKNQLGSPTNEENGDGFSDFLKKNKLGSPTNEEKEQIEGEVEDEDSDDSELHSIELNMDNNNKSYKWSFVCDGTNQGDSRRASFDEVFKGRKSLSEKVQWENICLQKKTSDKIEWDLTTTKQGIVNGFDKGRSSELSYANGENNNHLDEFKKYKMVKSQRLQSCDQGSNSPIMSTGRSSSRLREACTAILQDLALRREKIEGHSIGNKR